MVWTLKVPTYVMNFMNLAFHINFDTESLSTTSADLKFTSSLLPPRAGVNVISDAGGCKHSFAGVFKAGNVCLSSM